MKDTSNQTPQILDIQPKLLKIPNTQKNKKQFITIVISILIIAVMVICFIWLRLQKLNSEIQLPSLISQPANSLTETTSQSKNEIFFAIRKKGGLDIIFFNSKTNKITNSKTILFDDSLTSKTTNSSFGSEDSVQYNPQTQEIFFLTEEYGDDFESCLYKDSTCLSRIYKIGLNESTPVVIFESNHFPENWIVNSLDNSILLGFLDELEQEGMTTSFKKIDAQTGKIIFSKEYQTEIQSFAKFILSKDKKNIYQTTVKTIVDQEVFSLILQKFDNTNGDISSQEIFTGGYPYTDTYLSPDDNYLAFYSGKEEDTLSIFEISTQKIINIPYKGSIGNFGLYWSGDSKKLLFSLKEGTFYYDIFTSKITSVIKNNEQGNYIFTWAPSINYFICDSQGKVGLFDIQKNQITDTRVKSDSTQDFAGISWY